MQRHSQCCLPKGKKPFRHTTKGIFRLDDKIDILKEINAYGGVVFDSQGQSSPLPLFFFLPVCPTHSAPFSFHIQTDVQSLTGQFFISNCLIRAVYPYCHVHLITKTLSVLCEKLVQGVCLKPASFFNNLSVSLTGFKEGAVLPSISRGLSAPSGVRLHCGDVALPADFYHDIHRTPQV